jgi:YHS domain-containing protein
MKKLLIIAFVLVAVTQAAVFGQTLKTKYNLDDSKIALQGYSAVSYIDLGIAQVGNKQFKASHDGADYYFVDNDQKKKFEANPDKYLPQYGGFCAFGVSVGAKFRVNPYKYVVKDGKLYLFLYNLEVDAQQLWLQGNHSELVGKSNSNWDKLKSAN